MLKRERQWIWDGFHQAMAEMMVLGRNPGERVALRRLEEDKWQGWSARAVGVLLWPRFFVIPVPRERERSLHTCAQDVQITRMVTI
jgi:hypothetical protein